MRQKSKVKKNWKWQKDDKCPEIHGLSCHSVGKFWRTKSKSCKVITSRYKHRVVVSKRQVKLINEMEYLVLTLKSVNLILIQEKGRSVLKNVTMKVYCTNLLSWCFLWFHCFLAHSSLHNIRVSVDKTVCVNTAVAKGFLTSLAGVMG